MIDIINLSLLVVNCIMLLLGYALLLRAVEGMNNNKKLFTEFTRLVFKHLKRKR